MAQEVSGEEALPWVLVLGGSQHNGQRAEWKITITTPALHSTLDAFIPGQIIMFKNWNIFEGSVKIKPDTRSIKLCKNQII